MVEPSDKSQMVKKQRTELGLQQTKTDLPDEVLVPGSPLKKRP
jgi:hypothetical protein